ncbi:hypothetical protein DL764_006455 [Monosporascus ibericus]|uniref:DUF6594 domain-containing protein n=1 Tax=Monosporascus ibericus TaxID=155417 RepID=A0A4Q4T530_9PEZI|nr:hypothetical protein DL764_006455 [Monosporascus ibericus]
MEPDLEAQRRTADCTDGEPASSSSGHGDQSLNARTDRNGTLTSYPGGNGSVFLKICHLFKHQGQPEQASPPREIRRTINSTPNGYPKLGALIATNENYLIFREFKYLQARLLLEIQDQLREYEDELDVLERDNHITLVNLRSREMDDRHSGQRKELMRKIEDRYEKYREFLVSPGNISPFAADYEEVSILSFASSLALRVGPSNTDYNSLQNFFRNHAPLAWLFTDKAQAKGNANMLIYPRRALLVVKGLVLGIPLMALLIGPIYPLFELSTHELTEKTLTGIMFTQLAFTCLFAACLKFLTRPKRHELFAASVAYIGVLIVFMSQIVQKDK